MTAADLPTTHGIPNNGGEGFRFLGYPAYDSVINWDFAHTDKLADITPGLFTAWKIDEGNPLRWICDVRQGVKFHDGSDSTPMRSFSISAASSTTSRRSTMHPPRRSSAPRCR